jgi:hypothetical protein
MRIRRPVAEQAMRGGSVVHQKRDTCIVPPVAPPGWVKCCRCTQALAVSMRGCGTTGEVLGYERFVTSGISLLRQRFSKCGILLAIRRCAYVRMHQRLEIATKTSLPLP